MVPISVSQLFSRILLNVNPIVVFSTKNYLKKKPKHPPQGTFCPSQKIESTICPENNKKNNQFFLTVKTTKKTQQLQTMEFFSRFFQGQCLGICHLSIAPRLEICFKAYFCSVTGSSCRKTWTNKNTKKTQQTSNFSPQIRVFETLPWFLFFWFKVAR